MATRSDDQRSSYDMKMIISSYSNQSNTYDDVTGAVVDLDMIVHALMIAVEFHLPSLDAA